MYYHLKLLLSIIAICLLNLVTAQDKVVPGTFSGSLQVNGNFFIENDSIGANNTPQYDHQLYVAEA